MGLRALVCSGVPLGCNQRTVRFCGAVLLYTWLSTWLISARIHTSIVPGQSYGSAAAVPAATVCPHATGPSASRTIKSEKE